jgi:hypothetical protein
MSAIGGKADIAQKTNRTARLDEFGDDQRLDERYLVDLDAENRTALFEALSVPSDAFGDGHRIKHNPSRDRAW